MMFSLKVASQPHENHSKSVLRPKYLEVVNTILKNQQIAQHSEGLTNGEQQTSPVKPLRI